MVMLSGIVRMPERNFTGTTYLVHACRATDLVAAARSITHRLLQGVV
jgi:hypothetical protein